MWGKKIKSISLGALFVLAAFFFIGFESAELRSAWAQVEGTLNGWTVTSTIEQLEGGDIQASVSFDDNGTGGDRRGGVCLVTDLGLGRCETKEGCSEAAVERGFPGTGTGGWYHYCFAAATDEGTPGKHKRCWSRPGPPPGFCRMGSNNLPGAILTKAASPYGIANLDDDERDWTAAACLAGGTAPDGTTVGDPAACSLLSTAPDGTPLYLYVIDTPIEVLGQ